MGCLSVCLERGLSGARSCTWFMLLRMQRVSRALAFCSLRQLPGSSGEVQHGVCLAVEPLATRQGSRGESGQVRARYRATRRADE